MRIKIYFHHRKEAPPVIKSDGAFCIETQRSFCGLLCVSGIAVYPPPYNFAESIAGRADGLSRFAPIFPYPPRLQVTGK